MTAETAGRVAAPSGRSTADGAGAAARLLGLPAAVDAVLERRPRWTWLLVALLLSLVSVLVVVPAATGPGGMSPVDELWYTDAVDKAARGELTNTGDHVDEYARQVKACRGVIGIHGGTATCGGPQPDASLPLDGYTSADIHAPTYFFLTAGVAKVVLATGVTEDLLIAGRLAGVLWLTLGLVLVVAVGRAFGAGWCTPVLTAAAVGTSPLLVSVSGYLSPDALALAVGAGVLLAVVRWLDGRLPTALLPLVALSTAFVKVPFVLAALSAALLVLLQPVLGRRTPWRRALTGAGLLVAGAGAGAVVWQLVRGLLAVGVPTLHPDAEPPVALSSFGRYFGYYLDNIPAVSGAPLPVPPLLGLSVRPLVWLLLAAALGGLLLLPRGDGRLAACWAGMAAMLLGSMVLSLIVLVASGGFLIGTPRYGLALLPLYAVPLMGTRHPVAVVGLLLATVGSTVAHLTLW